MIVIYRTDNGLGLSKDALVVKNTIGLLTDEPVVFADSSQTIPARIAFHLEIPSFDGIRVANKNVMIPNPEWFMWEGRVLLFNVIMAKTKEAYDIFSKYKCEVVYSGFALPEVEQTTVKKGGCIHIKGGSEFKGTNAVLEAWRLNKNLPHLTIYSRTPIDNLPPNVSVNIGRFEEQTIVSALQSSAISIQPSLSEGFGYVLWEAVAAGNILITTDAPPMNEVPGLYATAKYNRKHWLGSMWDADPADIARLTDYASRMSATDVYDQVRYGKNRLHLMSTLFREVMRQVIE